VFVEIIGLVSERGNSIAKTSQIQKIMEKMTLTGDVRDVSSKDIGQEEKASSGTGNKAGGIQYEDYEVEESVISEDRAIHNDELETWQDDEMQCDLWNPVVNIPKRKNNRHDITNPSDTMNNFMGVLFTLCHQRLPVESKHLN